MEVENSNETSRNITLEELKGQRLEQVQMSEIKALQGLSRYSFDKNQLSPMYQNELYLTVTSKTTSEKIKTGLGALRKLILLGKLNLEYQFADNIQQDFILNCSKQLGEAKSLEQLVIKFHTYSSMNEVLINDVHLIPKLTTLSVVYGEDEQRQRQKRMKSQGSEQISLTKLILNAFSCQNLHYLSLDLPSLLLFDEASLTQLEKLQNLKQLTRFQVSLRNPLPSNNRTLEWVETFFNYVSKLPSLTYFILQDICNYYISEMQEVEIERIFRQVSQSLSVKSVYLTLKQNVVFGQTQPKKRMGQSINEIGKIKNLESLTLVVQDINQHEQLAQLDAFNQSNLLTLKLTLGVGFKNEQINVLGGLKSLRNLELIFDHDGSDYEIQQRQNLLVKVLKKLPKLQYLSVSLFEFDQIERNFKKLPSLIQLNMV